MTGFTLPREVVIGGKAYPIHTDYRDILEVFSYLEDPELPEFIRWQVALALFYGEPVEEGHVQQAVESLVWFVNGGKEEQPSAAPKLLDWEHDAQMIVADMNKVAGQEIRALPYVHWWTFLSWFHGIGEGQLSTVVSIRQKRLEGKALTDWEADYYRRNRADVELPERLSQQQREERQRLVEMVFECKMQNAKCRMQN